MSKSNRVLFIVASILLIVSAYTIVRLITINHSLRQSLPYLLKNEAIDYFELVDEEGNHITREAINKPSFIFIFSRPCSPVTGTSPCGTHLRSYSGKRWICSESWLMNPARQLTFERR
ncbi:MAG TPA: hypothetical protein ENN79_13080 [Desulfobacteraceae bacterium]|nr:hypothetical protein [Desulfobacteraceae bacterium]